MAIDGLSVRIDPLERNGCTTRSYVLVPFVTSDAYASHIADKAEQLRQIRALMAEGRWRCLALP